MSPPRKQPPPSTPDKNSDDEDKKVPAKKTSPSPKHPPPSHNNNRVSLPMSSLRMTDISSTSMNNIATSSPIRNPYVASLPHITSIGPTSMNSCSESSPSSDFLAKFGLKPSPIAATQTLKYPPTKISYLKCCPIDGGLDSAIIFRFEPNGTWYEKIMKDEITSHSPWTRSANFSERFYSWYHLNVVQVNPRNYEVKLFFLSTASISSPPELIELGKGICDEVNKLQQKDKNHVAQVADENSYFWVPGVAVWADVIGDEAAYNKLVEKIRSRPDGHEQWYQTNKNVIDTYFHSGTYSLNFARILGAPIEEVHPDARHEMFDPGDNEEADVDEDL